MKQHWYTSLLRWWPLFKRCTCTLIRVSWRISNLNWLLLYNVQNCILLNKLFSSSNSSYRAKGFSYGFHIPKISPAVLKIYPRQDLGPLGSFEPPDANRRTWQANIHLRSKGIDMAFESWNRPSGSQHLSCTRSEHPWPFWGPHKWP